MEKKYILALDQGTSSSRALLFDRKFRPVEISQFEFTQYYPQSGWVEQDPDEIFESQLTAARLAIKKSGILPAEIAAIGITNQRETTVIWNKRTGKPVCNAIVWQDRRTAGLCAELQQKGFSDYIKQTTGLVIDSYFSATKIRWILDNINADISDLAFGTIDTWIVWNLTKGRLHVTDYSNASRTMLFNIKDLLWDEKLLNTLNIPLSIMPKVVNSSELVGYTDQSIFGEEIPICGIAGDQQAALFGQRCFKEGMAKNTYGTGCFLLMNTGNEMVESTSGLVSTIGWGIENKIDYALEGSVFIAGASIKWLRDGIKIIQESSETDKVCNEVSDTQGVYFVPAFTGLGAPYWDMYARGGILGLTQGATDKHIIRAAVESIAYQTRDVLDAMKKDSAIELQRLYVDGGASRNNFLMQFQADIIGKQLVRPVNQEITALGAAFLAALSIGLCDMYYIENLLFEKETFNPKITEKEREILYNGWTDAVMKIIKR